MSNCVEHLHAGGGEQQPLDIYAVVVHVAQPLLFEVEEQRAQPRARGLAGRIVDLLHQQQVEAVPRRPRHLAQPVGDLGDREGFFGGDTAELAGRGIRLRWAAIAAGAFVVLMLFEVWTEDEPVGIADFLADALQTALIVTAATGVSLLTGRSQK